MEHLIMTNCTYLESKKGTVKTIEEWMEECDQFYKDLNLKVVGQWDRYVSMIYANQ
jgi:hypothetical protein